MAKDDGLLRLAHPSTILPAAAAVAGAAAVMHAAHVSWHDPAVGALVTASIAFGTRARPVAGAAAAAGAWVTAATAYGPLAGPWHLLAWTWGAAALAALARAHYHPAVRKARERRAARMHWLHARHQYGLGGSHLLEHEETRLGDRKVLDVTGTGKLASQIAGGGLAERIAQDEGLPVSRVQVKTHRIAGRIEVSRRFVDPWKHPIPHPLLDDDPEIVLPVPCTIREPLVIGQDPESGAPLTLTLWDEIGAKVVLIVAKRRSGKTVVLSDLRERVTAAEDADLWNINLSKAQEDRAWADACEEGYSACGPGERKQAFAILREARRLIDERGAMPRDTAVFQPTETDRLKVLVIDEVDALVAAGGQWARGELGYIASKAGSEGVALILAGQRATADWMGGGNVKANIDYVALGKVRSPGEVMHALGQIGFALPDMATYGEGRPGVWMIVEDSGDYQAGRAFNLEDLTDIRRIAAERAVRAPQPAMAGGAPPPVPPKPEVSSDFDLLDASMDEALPGDLRDKITRMDAKRAETHRILDETAEKIRNAPKVDPAKLAEATAQRWREAGEQAVIPDEARERLMGLLAGEGTTITRAAEFLAVSKWTMRCWLERLRQEGTVELVGQKRGARWRLIVPQDGDGT